MELLVYMVVCMHICKQYASNMQAYMQAMIITQFVCFQEKNVQIIFGIIFVFELSNNVRFSMRRSMWILFDQLEPIDDRNISLRKQISISASDKSSKTSELGRRFLGGRIMDGKVDFKFLK